MFYPVTEHLSFWYKGLKHTVLAGSEMLCRTVRTFTPFKALRFVTSAIIVLDSVMFCQGSVSWKHYLILLVKLGGVESDFRSSFFTCLAQAGLELLTLPPSPCASCASVPHFK